MVTDDLHEDSGGSSDGEAERPGSVIARASSLIRLHGVGAMSLQQLAAVSGMSPAEFSRHFPDLETVLDAVVAAEVDGILDEQFRLLSEVDSLLGLEAWKNAVLGNGRTEVHSCSLVWLVSELADHSETARTRLAAAFEAWESCLSEVLRRMQARGRLGANADPADLAIGIMAALQGGCLLAQTVRSPRPLAVALDMAIDRVRRQIPGEST